MPNQKDFEGIKRVLFSPLLALGCQNPLFPISEATYSEAKKLNADFADGDSTGIAAGGFTESIRQE